MRRGLKGGGQRGEQRGEKWREHCRKCRRKRLKGGTEYGGRRGEIKEKNATDVKGSVPAPTDVKYCELDNPSLLIRYVRKVCKSPLKLVTSLAATKLKTVVSPFNPLYKLQLTLARVTVATALPVEEMGPAPPSAASQIMISYSLLPLAVEDVKRS